MDFPEVNDVLDLQPLQQLITIAECGTMSAAARELHISQPALTRSMQRLESGLGVRLFERKKNRTALNEIGRLAVERARTLLREVEEFPVYLQDQARKLLTISIGSCAPAPMWSLAAELEELFPENAIYSEVKPVVELTESLQNGSCQFVITDRPVELPGILCRKYAEEQLMVSVPPGHPLGAQDTLRLADLAGQTMLLYHDLGIWTQIIRALEAMGVHFIVQKEREVFEELIAASTLPCFGSNMVHLPLAREASRVAIPVADEGAVVTYYLCTTPESKALLNRFAPPRGDV